MRFFLFLLLLLSVRILPAQVAVRGVVTDRQTGLPIQYALVRSATAAVYTDQEGKFSLNQGLEDSILRISASFYQPVNVQANTGKDLVVSLVPEELSIEAVTVTAYRLETGLLQATGPVSLITGSQISRNSAVALEPSLNQVPGVFMHSGSLNTNRITIRGIGSRTPYGTNKIRAYLDDIPLTSGDGETTLEDLSLLAISQVEVVRGPSSGLYGSGLGGAILLKTAPGKEALRVQTNFMTGSFGTHKEGISVSANLEKSSHLLVTDFLYSDGYRENNRYNRSNLFSYNHFELGEKSRLTFLFDFVDLRAYIPSSIDYRTYMDTPERAAANWAAVRGNEDSRKIRGAVTLKHDFSERYRLSVTALMSHSNNLELRPFNLLNEEAFTGSYRFTLDYRSEKFEWAAGTESFGEIYTWATYKNKAVSVENLLSNNKENRLWSNFFALAKWSPLPSLAVEPGVNFNYTRYDYYDRFTSDGDASGTRNFPLLVSPRLGANYQTSARNAIYGVVSHGFSAPSLQETLLPDGQANPEIKPETGWNMELGSRGKLLGNQLYYDISVYSMQISNLLVARRTGEDAFVGVNAGKTTHRGMEFDLRYYGRITRKLHWNLYASGTLARYRFDEFTDHDKDYSGNQLTGVPPVVLNNGIEIRTHHGWHTFLGHRYADKLPLNDANTVYSDSWHLFNWKAGKNFDFLGLNWKISGGINNIIDVKYASMFLTNAPSFGTTPPRYYYPGLPRNYYVTVQIGYIR